MTSTYKKIQNFVLYSIVFAAALSVSSFLANVLTARSGAQGRTASSPIPFTPVASADVPAPVIDLTFSGGGDCGGGGGGDGCGF